VQVRAASLPDRRRLQRAIAGSLRSVPYRRIGLCALGVHRGQVRNRVLSIAHLARLGIARSVRPLAFPANIARSAAFDFAGDAGSRTHLALEALPQRDTEPCETDP
jgi:hypothetical protein